MRSSRSISNAALMGAALSFSSALQAAETRPAQPVAPAAGASRLAAAPFRGQVLGIKGALPNVQQVEIATPHVYDYTFASAPTDWRVQSGVWEMTNRWSCSPGWSWFGGRSDETAAVWNKRKFSGDMSVQMYFAFKMGLSGADKWWEYAADAALTIGGDGQNLATGYSLIVGADGNTRTVLRKGNEVVAESREPHALLPLWSDGIPPDHDETMHRRWWYLRMDKVGSKISCYLDNKLLFTYDDPNPLDAGHVAVWTYNNGIMLSRVQIYHQNEVKPQPRLFVKSPRPASATPVAAAAKPAPVKIAQRP